MIIDLKGKWVLEDSLKEYKCNIEIPGDNISALYEAKIIEAPHWGNNETKIQWINKLDWTFFREFTIDDTDYTDITLNIDSLDTIGDIYINNELVGKTNNMFIPFKSSVKRFLNTGLNTIKIIIKSAENYALEMEKLHPYPVPFMPAPIQSPARNFVRKVQCHSGWDWGPCLMVSGVYNSIFLEFIDNGLVENWDMNYTLEGNLARITSTIDYFSYNQELLDIIILNDDGEEHKFTMEPLMGKNTFTYQFTKEVDLWWPNGYGEQPLYNFKLLIDGKVIEKRIGFRTLIVVNETDEYGKNLYFKVNGVDIFSKGANWIPVDALPLKQTHDKYNNLLQAAKDSNMNIIRVWGGGQYEKDIFYDLCDQNGLLVWQDFMFSCAAYPADIDFLNNVKREATYWVKKLKNRACLALWCGNNENLGALTWFDETKKNRDIYLVDYDRLNEGTIGKTVKELAPKSKWWPSSPCAGENDYSDCWHDDSRGDMHYWSVWHEGKSFDSYYNVVPRFCSEFGFQSFPSISVINSFADEKDKNVTSPIMEHHQRSPKGNQIILETISRYYLFPKDFENFTYISQIQQSFALETAISYWRSKRPICMGIMFWQLNDLWPVSSWASVEYGGKWKPLMYTIKRIYEPLFLFSYIEKNNVFSIGVVNDTALALNSNLDLEFIDFKGTVLWSKKYNFTALGEKSTVIDLFPLGDFPFNESLGFFYGKTDFGSTTTFLTVPKKCAIEKCNIEYILVKEGKNCLITLKTDVPAFNVVLDIGNLPCRLSDNNFTLIPNKPLEIRLYGENDTDKINNNLRVYSLNNSN